jgi:hypothetical protein
MKRLRPQLSYANVIATLALFLALAGGAVAASHLGKNSVGSKQLKKNAVTTAKIKKQAVTGAKVKKDTLTGTQINEAKLGTVPNANHAVSADTVASEPTHFIGAPGEPPFSSGSSNAPGEMGVVFPRAGFFKDQAGVVHLQGIVKVGPTLPILFTLPPGFRPAQNTIAIQNAFCFGNCETDEGGDEETYTRVLMVGSGVVLEKLDLSGDVLASGEEGVVSLEGITFRAES